MSGSRLPADLAVGVDLASVAGVRDSIRDFGDRYLTRIFTTHELRTARRSADPAPHLAARLAAKEATIKALRVAGSQPPWTSMELFRHADGRCDMRLSGSAARLAADRGVTHLAVSVTHEGELAVAVVVATGASPG